MLKYVVSDTVTEMRDVPLPDGTRIRLVPRTLFDKAVAAAVGKMKTPPDYKAIARSIVARYPNVMRLLAKAEADEKIPAYSKEKP